VTVCWPGVTKRVAELELGALELEALEPGTLELGVLELGELELLVLELGALELGAPELMAFELNRRKKVAMRDNLLCSILLCCGSDFDDFERTLSFGISEHCWAILRIRLASVIGTSHQRISPQPLVRK
jgi:hypothetical protein